MGNLVVVVWPSATPVYYLQALAMQFKSAGHWNTCWRTARVHVGGVRATEACKAPDLVGPSASFLEC